MIRKNNEYGVFAVKLARNAIEEWVKNSRVYRAGNVPDYFKKDCGAFVTINSYPANELRGCIGFPYPAQPLYRAIIDAAIEATHDPRFPPLKEDELSRITVEVSILTPPKRLTVKKPEEYVKKIKIGRDGLIIKYGFYSGLLLPQVAVEYGWDAKTFLQQLCFKAGLPADAWKSNMASIYTFQARIYREKKPRGEVEEVRS